MNQKVFGMPLLLVVIALLIVGVGSWYANSMHRQSIGQASVATDSSTASRLYVGTTTRDVNDPLVFSYIPVGWNIARKDEFGFVARSPDYAEQRPVPGSIDACPTGADGSLSEGCAINQANEENTPVMTKGAYLWYNIQPNCKYGESDAEFETRIKRNNVYGKRFIKEENALVGGRDGILATYEDGYNLTVAIDGDCHYVDYRYTDAVRNVYDREWKKILNGVQTKETRSADTGSPQQIPSASAGAPTQTDETANDLATTTIQEGGVENFPLPPHNRWIPWQQVTTGDCPAIINPQNGEMYVEYVKNIGTNGNTNNAALVTQFPHADLVTFMFQVTENDNHLCPEPFSTTLMFAKDKNRVYRYDPPGYFAGAVGGDAKDANYRSPSYKTTVDSHHYFDANMVDADPGTFEVLSDLWAKDKSHAYWLGENPKLLPIENADPSTFEALPGGWGKDKSHIYKAWNGKVTPIAGIDGATFRYLGKTLFRDKNNIYYHYDDSGYMGATGEQRLIPIQGIDPDAFDPASFTQVSAEPSSYPLYKDRKHLYVMAQDLSSFTTILQEGVDVDSVTDVYAEAVNIYKDKNHVYRFVDNRLVIVGKNLLDPATLSFTGFGPKGDAYIFKDKNHIYTYSDGTFTVLPTK